MRKEQLVALVALALGTPEVLAYSSWDSLDVTGSALVRRGSPDEGKRLRENEQMARNVRARAGDQYDKSLADHQAGANNYVNEMSRDEFQHECSRLVKNILSGKTESEQRRLLKEMQEERDVLTSPGRDGPQRKFGHCHNMVEASLLKSHPHLFPHEILGVSPDADAITIHEKYQRELKELRNTPSRSQAHLAEINKKMSSMAEAFSKLIDPNTMEKLR